MISYDSTQLNLMQYNAMEKTLNVLPYSSCCVFVFSYSIHTTMEDVCGRFIIFFKRWMGIWAYCLPPLFNGDPHDTGSKKNGMEKI